ncbi:hypothetical protein [Paenibacillus alvei]|uniref:hypothetical protein n=1 Tax=Paenibacillus alvei TaxID=44250 RepID=UPI0013DD5D7B|nr:hypothetical protein [Paenibacillus alvei]NEZ41387.1 hypothetical protein [Paenibacillus alvei]
MRKVKLTIRETLVYEREAVVLMPEGIPGSINELLDAAERQADNADEFTYYLSKNGCQIVEDVSRDLDCPESEEVEAIDYDILEESTKDE